MLIQQGGSHSKKQTRHSSRSLTPLALDTRWCRGNFSDTKSAECDPRQCKVNLRSVSSTKPARGGTCLSFWVLEWRVRHWGSWSEWCGVSQSVDLGRSNNPNTIPTKDYKKVRVVVYLCGVQRGCAEEGERGSTPTGWYRQRYRILLRYRSNRRWRG